MFDKKNAAKVKTVDYALSPEGQKIVGEVGIFRWTNKG
jgi:ABC-type Fe3+ transport system substrate-binding protein